MRPGSYALGLILYSSVGAAHAVDARGSWNLTQNQTQTQTQTQLVRRLGSSSDTAAVFVRWTRSKDASSWRKYPTHEAAGCINPSPFGKQCTAFRSDALMGCLMTSACAALVCPDQGPYRAGNKKGLNDAICQYRDHSLSDERNHGMCRPQVVGQCAWGGGGGGEKVDRRHLLGVCVRLQPHSTTS